MTSRRYGRNLRQSLKWWWDTRIAGKLRIRTRGWMNKRQMLDQHNKMLFSQHGQSFAEVPAGSITAILTVYRRAEYLREQVQALRDQTVQPLEVWAWSNSSEEELLDFSDLVDRVVVSNTNWKFWGRFALANLARTEYVAVFDDDVLPQPGWFENCLRTLEEVQNGILGGSGVLLPEQGGYSSRQKIGWNGEHLDHAAEVDLVGHAWFMPKKNVGYMWREEPYSWENGEDMHLSYMAQKHGGIKTYVPPHPEDDPSSWSCRPDFGKVVGRTNPAAFKTTDHKSLRSEIVEFYRRDGWKVLSSGG